MLQSVHSANHQHWHLQAVFSPEYADFVWMLASNFYSSPMLLAREVTDERQLVASVGALKLMQLAQIRRDCPDLADFDAGDKCSLQLLVCRCAVSFVCNVLARSRDRSSLPEWTSLLCRMLQRAGPPAQRWFGRLLASHGFVREALLECPLPDARNAVLVVAVRALRWLYEGEALALGAHAAATAAAGGSPRSGQPWTAEQAAPEQIRASAERGGDAPAPPLLAEVWATLMELLPVAMQVEAHGNFSQFLALLLEFLGLGPEAVACARASGGLEALVEFALQEKDGTALRAALERACRWYQPNWLRSTAAVGGDGAPASSPPEAGVAAQAAPELVLLLPRPVPREVVMGTAGAEGAAPTADAARAEIASAPAVDASFERNLYSDAGDFIDLGPLWASITTLLEQDRPRCALESEEHDALLRRLVRLGGTTPSSARPASRLLQLLCRGNLPRSQSVICRVCERVDECDGHALRAVLRMGSALVDLSDALVQQRSIFLVKSVLHVAKNNRRYFATMQLVVHYVIKWCKRRPELPQWLLRDAGGGTPGAGPYRWLEGWLKEN